MPNQAGKFSCGESNSGVYGVRQVLLPRALDEWSSDLNLNGVSLDFYASHGFSVTNTMFNHGAQKSTWYQSTSGQRSIIDFIVIPSDLRLRVLDTQVQRGARLSTDHHLSGGEWGQMGAGISGQTWETQTCSECELECLVEDLSVAWFPGKWEKNL